MTKCCGIKTTALLFLLVVFSMGAAAQYHAQRQEALNANSNWFFGEYGLKPAQQFPQALATPAFYNAYTGFYGTGAFKNKTVSTRYPNVIPVSDPTTGSLKFTATLSRLLDRNFNVMPNGDFSDLHIVNENYEKSVLIAPVIRDPMRYFHFSLAVINDTVQLLQSVVNMQRNSGLGDVETTGARTLISQWKNENIISELIDVVPGNNCDLWLLVAVNHVNTEARFEIRSFHITEAGIDNNPVVSFFDKDNPFTMLWDYQLSPDRRRLAVISYQSTNAISFFDFNAEDGTLTGSALPAITFPGVTGSYDVHGIFTPDNQYFIAYANELRDQQALFYKYDLTAANAGYRVENFTYPIPYITQGPWDMYYLAPVIYFKAYNNKLYMNIPKSIREKLYYEQLPGMGPPVPILDEYGNPYYGVTAHSTPKIVGFGPPAGSESWSHFAFDPEITLSENNRLFTNSSVNYPYLTDDTIPTVYDSVFCLEPGEPFPTATLSAPGGFVNYVWNDGTSGATKVINQPGKYWVFYKGSCNNRVDTFNYRLWTPTKVLPPDTVVCEQRLPFVITPLQDGQYFWEDIGSAAPERDINAPGVYKVRFSDLGCTQFDSIVVQTKNCPCGISMPNAFSPNNDGLNDYFKPIIAIGCVPGHYNLRIFNRWGQPVYQSFNEFDQGWDGSYNGNRGDVGVYFYELRFDSPYLDQPYLNRGEVILVR